MFRQGEDGLYDGLCCGDGSWSHVRHFLMSQDRDARPGADGRSGKDHDAERRHFWDIYGYWNGYPLLRTNQPKCTPNLSTFIYGIITNLWDCFRYNNIRNVFAVFLSSFVNKCSEM